jgi:hypothetical protein
MFCFSTTQLNFKNQRQSNNVIAPRVVGLRRAQKTYNTSKDMKIRFVGEPVSEQVVKWGKRASKKKTILLKKVCHHVFATPAIYLLNDIQEVLRKPFSVMQLDSQVDWCCLLKDNFQNLISIFKMSALTIITASGQIMGCAVVNPKFIARGIIVKY